MTHPLFLLLTFIGLVSLLWRLEAQPKFRPLFRITPLPFWCYILPTIATTLGWLPAESPLYGILSQQLLPVCLVLLLIGTDLKSLVRLGPLATGLMIFGAVGTMAGGLIGFALYRHWLPEGTWAGIGALSASWIGGSANLIAVKEALHVPDGVIGPLIIIDAVVAYSWMALLIWASGFQEQWERLIQHYHSGTEIGRTDREATRGMWGEQASEARAGMVSRGQRPRDERGILRSAAVHAGDGKRPANPHSRACGLAMGITLAILVSLLAQYVAGCLPTLGMILNRASWTILLVTTVSLALSLTPLRKLEKVGISRAGTFFLYILLASIGARANLKMIAQTPIFLALGLTWILIHGAFQLFGGFLLKAPLGLISTSSQANIGGTVSAPIVGATYNPQLATIGLLMAIFGNILGTYLGLLTAFLARAFSGAA